MGKKDTLTKEYLSQNDVFADAFNYYLYNGVKVIKPDELTEQDSTEIALLRKLEKTFPEQKIRDVLRLCTIKHNKDTTFVLLGIEGQANIHYAMPVRHYLYDALNYASQVEKFRKKHRDAGDLEGNEYLSGFGRNDKLIPVITLCICFDKERWDAPRSLYDMFDNIDPRIREYIDDYRLNLITPDEVADYKFFSSELGLVLEFIKESRDKESLWRLVHDRTEYSNVDVTTVDMINEYTKIDISTKDNVGGKMDMCKAMQELIQDGKEEGIKEGIKEGEDRLAKLLRLLTPGSEEFDKALNAGEEDRMKLYKKYNII